MRSPRKNHNLLPDSKPGRNPFAGFRPFSILIVAALGFAASLYAGNTVLDGVYTTAQAESGHAVYTAKCASCHGADLGGFSGPPLKGDLFLDRWREFNLEILFNLIKNSMPATAPGTLTIDNYLDTLAYLLQANSIPAGSKKLTADALASTLLVGKDGSKPLPGSAQVEVVGCMTEDSGNGWFLTSAAEPARTLDAFSITAEELTAAKTKVLGGLVFRLENLSDIGFSPEASIGKKMDAKGILVRQPKGDRINVTAIQIAVSSCAP